MSLIVFLSKDLTHVNKGKHIVFDSDDEINNDSENTTSRKANLFDEGSDDEDGAVSEAKQVLGEKVKNQRDTCFFSLFLLSFLVIIVVLFSCYFLLRSGLCRN